MRAPAPRVTRPFRLCTPLLLTGWLIGCTSFSPRDLTLGPSYQPENVFLATPALPPTLKRVAVLPLAADAANLNLTEAQPALEAVLQAEVAKLKKFEVVEVSPQYLRSRTGRPNWGGEEALPPDLLETVGQTFGCDAVLFCRLTVFRGYAPLAVGWRLRLVQVSTARLLWAADEVFDAGRPTVQAGARRYQLAELRVAGQPPDEWTIAHSPGQFARYAAAQVLATLPQR